MLVLVASLYEFLQFLKIVMWISIPLFLLSSLIVVFMHYRRKKKNALSPDPVPHLEFALAGSVSRKPLENVFLQQLNAGKEQYAELESDLKQLKNRYMNLITGSDNTNSEGSVKIDEPARSEMEKQLKQYELKIAQLQQAIDYLHNNSSNQEDWEKSQVLIAEKNKEISRLQSIVEQLNREIALLSQQNDSKTNEIQKLDRLLKEMQESARQASTEARDLQLSYQEKNEEKDRGHFEENKKLSAQLKELHDQFRNLEEENSVLLQKLQDYKSEKLQASNTETEQITVLQESLNKAADEIAHLKSRLLNADSLEEIVQEKKAEIEFLQQQLEQRIRTAKQSEQKYLDHETQVAQFRQELQQYEEEKHFLLEDILLKTEELKKQEQQIEEGSAENRQLKKELLDKDDRLSVLQQETGLIKMKLGDYEQEILRNQRIADALTTQLEEARRQIGIKQADIDRKKELLSSLHQQLDETIREELNNHFQTAETLATPLPRLAEQASL